MPCFVQAFRKFGEINKDRKLFGNLQISFFAEVGTQEQGQLTDKYTREDKGHANEGWQINKEVMSSKVCTDFDDKDQQVGT